MTWLLAIVLKPLLIYLWTTTIGGLVWLFRKLFPECRLKQILLLDLDEEIPRLLGNEPLVWDAGANKFVKKSVWEASHRAPD